MTITVTLLPDHLGKFLIPSSNIEKLNTKLKKCERNASLSFDLFG